MKLFYVCVIDDTEEYTEIVVANSKEEAEEKVLDMEKWDCLICTNAFEIDIVDGYKINLEKLS